MGQTNTQRNVSWRHAFAALAVWWAVAAGCKHKQWKSASVDIPHDAPLRSLYVITGSLVFRIVS